MARISPVVGSSITTAPRSVPRPVDGRLLERRARVAERQLLRVVRVGLELAEQRRRSGSAAETPVSSAFEGALEAGRPELPRGVADDRR